MRSIQELVGELRRANVRVWSEGDQLRYRATAGALTVELKSEMRQRKGELLEFCRRARPEPQVPPLGPIPRNGPLAISLSQQRLWLLQQIEGPSPTYNVAQALLLTGRLDLGVLERSLGEIIRRHEALRTTFTLLDDEVRQRIAPYNAFQLPAIDVRDRPSEARLAEVRRQACAESLRAFDLDAGPLVRFVLWRVDDERHVLQVVLHHIISDGHSIGILTHELASWYEALCRGREPSLPELTVQCADFAAWQRTALREELLTNELEYWRQQLDGLPPLLELPTDRPRPPRQTSQGAFHRLQIDAPLLAGIKPVGDRDGLHPVHWLAHRPGGCLVSLYGADGHSHRLSCEPSRPAGNRTADRLLHQYAGLARRSFGRSHGPRITGACERRPAGWLGPSERAV